MTFFDWFSGSQDGNSGSKNDGRPRVSGYIWIYFVITIAFTLATLLLWWFFLVYKRRPARKLKKQRRSSRVLCSGLLKPPFFWRRFKISVSYDEEKEATPM
jgi:hypothetical protein